MELKDWLHQNDLDGEIDSCFLKLNDRDYFILAPEGDKVLNERFEFNLPEVYFATEKVTEFVVFEFGSNWYWSSVQEPKFNLLKHIGKSNSSKQGFDVPYLGIHGKYDFCNGSRDYTDWCMKAKFLGISTLGICESDTLAGTLSFQTACQAAGIKSILGETVTVKDKEEQYKLKLYCINETGWRNLLNINAQIKVFNEGFVDWDYVWEGHEGLVCVVDCSKSLSVGFINKCRSTFGANLYYQFDPVEWANPTKEESHLELIKEYIHKYKDRIKPVLICDSYYLDKEDAPIRKMLNSMGKIGFQNQSYNQYFKSFEDIVSQCDELFKNDVKSGYFINELIQNTTELSEVCNFQIKLGELHLPKYELTEEEKKNFKDSEELFWSLIEKGLQDKILGQVEDEQIYLDRVQMEVDVINEGHLIDYFLIIWDIINWCEQNNILTSIGRGSAAGSLVSYLLGIVKLNPIEHGLLFERFLSKARLGKSLPDIDSDIQSDRRNDVKRYIEERYGIDYVTSIGTYGTFKIKASIKDIGKYFNIDFSKTNYITSIISDDCDFTEIFKSSLEISSLKNFLQQYPQVIESYPLVAYQPRTVSIHAAGIIIVPKSYNGEKRTIYDWMPVKKIDDVLVTEWEGEQLEQAGFLKADVLGISQLQKFAEIIKLIKQNHSIDISFNDMVLDDSKVYELFQNGYNEDVFQFGAPGLKTYCKELKPENIEDLTATVALYRPGPIESGAHKDYVKIKNGLKYPEYDYMLEEVTKATYGLYVYQEQIMQAMHRLGNLTLVEAEDVRKAMGKKMAEKMEGYKTQFIEGAIKNNCPEFQAIAIWNKLERFASYGFNKSHAAAYAHVGFFSQWLKCNFPIEFWSVSLHHSSSNEISKRIGEIHKVSDIQVLPPDINNSVDVFKPDFENQRIYWSISSIKQIGEATMKEFLKERNERGAFFSFEDFYNRIEKRVNKRGKLNLILAGCFDIIEKLKSPSDRIFVVKKLYDILGEDIPEEFKNSSEIAKDHFWILKQKELTGFGYFDFEKIYKRNAHLIKNTRYLDAAELLEKEVVDGDKRETFCIAGILTEVIERSSKKGPFAQIVINSNDENIICLIWSEIWEDFKELVSSSINKVILITGEIRLDTYRKINVLQTTAHTKLEIL